VSGHWLDSYGNRIDHRSWRVPYIPIEEWKKRTEKQKITLYEQFREQTLERYGFDIASERRPPGWLPHTPVPSAAGLAAPIDQDADDLFDRIERHEEDSSRWKPPPLSYPAMPVIPNELEAHRQKDLPPLYPACVAKLVPPKDRLNIPAAKKALDQEWDELKRAGKNGCWNEAMVRERFEVEREARASRETVHFGRVHELCYLKNSELPEADPRRKYKGRAVFLGDQVKDQDGNVA
jgi:hypothetical protein